MLRIISLFLLLIISQISFADTIPAVSSPTTIYYSYAGGSYAEYSGIDDLKAHSPFPIHAKYKYCAIVNPTLVNCNEYSDYSGGSVNYSLSNKSISKFTCPSGYTLSDSAGNADSSGAYCTKESCTTKTGTNQMVEIANGEVAPVMGCYQGCSGTNLQYLYDNKAWTCAAGSGLSCAFNMQFDGNSCTVSSSSSSSASSGASGDGCGGNGSSTGTVNGQPVTVCNAAASSSSSSSDSNTSTSSSPGTDSPSSGLGTDAGSPETNTSGSQNSTVGGGVGGLSGDGFGDGGSAGSSGGTDSGGTSGSSSGTDSGGTSGGTSGSSSGTDSGGTSGGSAGGGGTDSGGASGSGGGTDSGTGAATSGAGGTDSDTPAEEEEESGDGGGSFSAPGKGTDYLKDVFGESDLSALATDNAELTTKINQKMADVKSVFNLGVLSVSGDMPENQQEIKGASVDLSGRNIFERFSIVAAAFYLCAIATAIYIVMGGKK